MNLSHSGSKRNKKKKMAKGNKNNQECETIFFCLYHYVQKLIQDTMKSPRIGIFISKFNLTT